MDHLTPFTTEVRATAFVANGHDHGVNLSYFGRDGRPVASAFATLDDVEAHAHDLLGLVAAARGLEGKVRFGNAPRVRSALMRDLVEGEPDLSPIARESAPCASGGIARLDRFLTSIPQVRP